jgi:hypothetical protein
MVKATELRDQYPKTSECINQGSWRIDRVKMTSLNLCWKLLNKIWYVDKSRVILPALLIVIIQASFGIVTDVLWETSLTA